MILDERVSAIHGTEICNTRTIGRGVRISNIDFCKIVVYAIRIVALIFFYVSRKMKQKRNCCFPISGSFLVNCNLLRVTSFCTWSLQLNGVKVGTCIVPSMILAAGVIGWLRVGGKNQWGNVYSVNHTRRD